MADLDVRNARLSATSDGRWRDLGLIFRVEAQARWMRSHAYVPTACVLADRVRVFAAFWDEQRIGRVGYVDLDLNDPTRVLGYSDKPILDIGAPGAFDEHGVTPMSVVQRAGVIWLYYAGWQKSLGSRYLLFTGLALSRDGGESFERYSDVPVIDRAKGHTLVRTGFIDNQDGVWKAWLAQSDGLADIAGAPTPTYSLAYLESLDGVNWPSAGKPCLPDLGEDVFGLGRSAVWRDEEGYHAMLSVRRKSSGYRLQYASSADGAAWSAPRDERFSLSPNQTNDGQSETMFASRFSSSGRTYVLYNGDGFGEAGVRCAVWEESA